LIDGDWLFVVLAKRLDHVGKRFQAVFLVTLFVNVDEIEAHFLLRAVDVVAPLLDGRLAAPSFAGASGSHESSRLANVDAARPNLRLDSTVQM
jgi:hypothetical protein